MTSATQPCASCGREIIVAKAKLIVFGVREDNCASWVLCDKCVTINADGSLEATFVPIPRDVPMIAE